MSERRCDRRGQSTVHLHRGPYRSLGHTGSFATLWSIRICRRFGVWCILWSAPSVEVGSGLEPERVSPSWSGLKTARLRRENQTGITQRGGEIPTPESNGKEVHQNRNHMAPSHMLTSHPVHKFRSVKLWFYRPKRKFLKFIFSTTTHRTHTGTPSHNTPNTKYLCSSLESS
jgi:hypothetical protein